MTLTVAIVGAGPAGFYAADALGRKLPQARIDLFDRLAVPYGLARFGVAPDHQGTKAIIRVFERIAQKAGIRFLGNVAIGKDVALAELRDLYDAVILATGAPEDRRLGLPGEDLPGIFGSSAFTGWYNCHPDRAALAPNFDGAQAAVVIGNGNVAIDVVRVLAKTPVEMAKSDISPDAAASIHGAALRDIYMVGRRGPLEASFTTTELAELGKLERCVPLVESADLPPEPPGIDKVKAANLQVLREFSTNQPGAKPLQLHFRFHAAPTAFLGEGRVEAVRFTQPDGGTVDIGCSLAVTCIGYRSIPVEGVPFDTARGLFQNQDGRVAPGLYVTGWAKRGPSGVIASNRADGLAVADKIAADHAESAKSGHDALDRLLAERKVRIVDFAAWRRIDAAEIAAGGGGAPRRKFNRLEEMLAALD